MQVGMLGWKTGKFRTDADLDSPRLMWFTSVYYAENYGAFMEFMMHNMST